MKFLLVTTVAVCLCALQAAAQTQPVFHDEGGLLAKIQQVRKGDFTFVVSGRAVESQTEGAMTCRHPLWLR